VTLSPTRRTGLYFFTQFMAGGTANAFAGIWFSQQGLSDVQIGLLTTVPTAILLAINIFVGRIADRASDWRLVILWGAALSAFATLGLFWSSGFALLLLFFTATVITQSMIVPVADAAAMHLTQQHGGNLGTMRGLSTFGYLAGLLASGFLIGHFGAWLFLPLFVGFSFARFGGAALLPNFKSRIVPSPSKGPHRFRNFLRPWLMLPLLGWAVVYATHQVLNGFQSLLWSQQGISTTMISILIGVGAASEMIAFFLFQRVQDRMPIRLIILLSGVVTVLRWMAMATMPPVALLFPLQALHGITFALGFLACVTYVGRHTHMSAAAEAQSFFLVLQQIAAIVVISIFSWLASGTAGNPFWGNAVMALAGTLLIVFALRLPQAKEA
jgi:MFS transporter, PPP family, 3-phenylpropionic acid transporter